MFHNRRWDADIQTLAAVLESAELGEPWGVESRMDQANAATLEIGPDAGLLRDLGSHLVDQMLWLLGPARTVYAELDLDVEPAGGRTDCRFALSLTHAGGCAPGCPPARSIISRTASCAPTAAPAPTWPTAPTSRPRPSSPAGGRSTRATAGVRRPRALGHPPHAAGSRAVPSERGAYQDYYTRFAAALRGDGDFPVPAAQAVTRSRCWMPPGSAPPRTAWSTSVFVVVHAPVANRRGVVPTRRVKCRCRWDWSWKPTAAATSAMCSPSSSRRRAASTRLPTR